MENHILQSWGGKLKAKKSPKAKAKGPKGGSWKAIFTGHLTNVRDSLFYYLGRRAESQDSYLDIRYQEKQDFYKEHYVRIH